MAWTTPPTFASGQVVTAADLNSYLRDNTNYLFSGRPSASVLRVTTSDYSTNSSSFVDIDSTNLVLTLTVSSGRVLLMMNATWGMTGGAAAYLDWIVDSTTRLGGTYGLMAGGVQSNVCLVGLATGLSVGSHSFKPQYRSSGSLIYAYNTGFPIALYAWEV